MLIFRGWGILVLVLGFACFLLTQIAVGRIFDDEGYYQDHAWPKGAACVLLATLLFLLDLVLRRWALREPEEDSFFFIPVRWWPPILLVLAGVALFVPWEGSG